MKKVYCVVSRYALLAGYYFIGRESCVRLQDREIGHKWELNGGGEGIKVLMHLIINEGKVGSPKSRILKERKGRGDVKKEDWGKELLMP